MLSDSEPCVANFAGGLSGFSGVYQHLGGELLFVVAGGQGYILDSVYRRVLTDIGGAITGVWERDNPRSLLLDHQGIAFERIGPKGRLWRSRRLSWDGFKELNVTSETLVLGGARLETRGSCLQSTYALVAPAAVLTLAPTLYIDSPVKCDHVGVGDSPFDLGSARPSVSGGVAHHRRSSQTRTVDRASSPHLARSGRDESALPGGPDE